MRLLHVSIVDVAEPTAASEHVLGLAQGLTELGHEVAVLAPATGRPVKQGRYDLRTVQASKGGFARARSVRQQLGSVLDDVMPDVVYLRTFPLDYLYVLRLCRSKGIPVVAELNTMARDEYRALGYRIRAPFLARFEAMSLQGASGWVPMTNEIHDYAKSLSGVADKPTRLGYNAFDAADLPELDVRARTRRQHGAAEHDTVLVMAGFGYPWHGVDRAIESMHLLDDSHHLWLVGARNNSDRALVDQHSTRASRRRIRVFENLPTEDLIQLFAGADVGLGSLALDRHPFTQAQPVKVALYLALGLPVIINYEDVRFEGKYPFLARMSSNRPEALADALEELKPITPALRAQTAQYAAHHLSWREAARHTVDLIDSICR